MPRAKKVGLEKRFAVFGLVFAGALALIYTLLSVFMFLTAESKLMTAMMDAKLDEILTYDVAFGHAPRLDHKTRFYSDSDPQRLPPESFAKLPQGYSEELDGDDLHIYKKTVDGRSYYLTHNQSEFEEWEQRVYLGAFAFLLCVCVMFYFLFKFIGRRFIRPLDRLAGQTRRLDAELSASRFSDEVLFDGEWPNNEIGELAFALRTVSDRLKTVLRNERSFLSEVSHELRTPLMIISTSGELLSMNPDLDARSQRQLNQIINAAQRMNGIISSFLDLAGKQNGAMESHLMSLGELAREKEPYWRELAAKKNPPLELSVDPGRSGEGRYNRFLVESVLDNLIKNAVNYTPEGQVRVSFFPDSIEIVDTGIGITEKDRERIFNAGYRGTAGKFTTGFGIGLAVAKRVCDSLGWRIGLESDVGKGTKIRIELPK